ncbi:MAG: D-aminoacyl-tRNA deacylase, partial [Prevotella sp.]|nr:D-aminoacyl-tRNA deacylase [Prevotella sp.]
MKVVIQRVSRASVTIDQKVKSGIGKGMLVLLGVADGDTQEDAQWLAKK